MRCNQNVLVEAWEGTGGQVGPTRTTPGVLHPPFEAAAAPNGRGRIALEPGEVRLAEKLCAPRMAAPFANLVSPTQWSPQLSASQPSIDFD
jgi:hypothetical protein